MNHSSLLSVAFVSVLGSVFAPAAEAAPAVPDILAVDRQGQPVAGVRLELVDTIQGTFGASDPTREVVTGADGRAAFPEGRAPLDLRSADPAWGISFLHGAREVDETLGEDMNGKKAQVLDTSATVAVVLVPTGTLEIEVVGGKAGAKYFATFMDERPELYSHRQLRESGSFSGPKGAIRLSAGRGTLYLAEEDHLGAYVLGAGAAPHIVSISSSSTTKLRVRFLDGPVTTLQAPFESIPFDLLEAMAPDGRTATGSFPFESSPLRLPCHVAAAMGTGFEENMLGSARLPKHLLRAADIPLVRPAIPLQDPVAGTGLDAPPENQPNPRLVAPAPLDLVFAVDLGGKLRLPEVESGWVKLAKEGAMIAAGIVAAPRRANVTRPKPGVIRMPNAFVGEAGPMAGSESDDAGQWMVSVTALDAGGKPAGHCELLVSSSNGTLIRSLTDGGGKLLVYGLSGASASVAFVDDLGARVAAEKPRNGTPFAASVAVEVRRGGAPCPVTGTWFEKAGGPPKVGQYLALVPRDDDERRARQAFLTRSVAISTVDSEGRFAFEPVPPGAYYLRTGEGAQLPLDVVSSSGALILPLLGSGKAVSLVN